MRRRPSPEVVFLTGGAFTPESRDFLACVPNLSLDKPFDLDVLFETIARVRAS